MIHREKSQSLGVFDGNVFYRLTIAAMVRLSQAAWSAPASTWDYRRPDNPMTIHVRKIGDPLKNSFVLTAIYYADCEMSSNGFKRDIYEIIFSDRLVGSVYFTVPLDQHLHSDVSTKQLTAARSTKMNTLTATSGEIVSPDDPTVALQWRRWPVHVPQRTVFVLLMRTELTLAYGGFNKPFDGVRAVLLDVRLDIYTFKTAGEHPNKKIGTALTLLAEVAFQDYQEFELNFEIKIGSPQKRKAVAIGFVMPT